MEEGGGILRIVPTWVPRAFYVPGRHMKLHPDDYFALGAERGGIGERWLSSDIRADNGPLTGEDEGLSFVSGPEEMALPFDEFVDHLGADVIGQRLWERYGAWTMYSKFFDNEGPLPFHVHHNDDMARLIGRKGKPEAYFFPPQLNNHLGSVPVSFLGLDPGTSQTQFKEYLAGYGIKGDNRITDLSLAYRIQLGTGWDMPASSLHAPASVGTYEPQAASDVFAMCECWTSSRTLPDELLWKDIPQEQRGDLDFVVALLDWEKNTDPNFRQSRFMGPLEVEQTEEAVQERWIVYKSSAFSAKELTLAPRGQATVKDAAAYGYIAVQGRGALGRWTVETPTLIRFGQLTADEYFVCEDAARTGIIIKNANKTGPLVLLKLFGPDNPNTTIAREPEGASDVN